MFSTDEDVWDSALTSLFCEVGLKEGESKEGKWSRRERETRLGGSDPYFSNCEDERLFQALFSIH